MKYKNEKPLENVQIICAHGERACLIREMSLNLKNTFLEIFSFKGENDVIIPIADVICNVHSTVTVTKQKLLSSR